MIKVEDPPISDVASALGLVVWKPGEPILAVGDRLLVGVAPYSNVEIGMLYLFARAKSDPCLARPILEVFDTLDCQTHEQFNNFIPGIGTISQTPVAGFWSDGLLLEKAQGAAARALIGRRYCLTNEIEAFVGECYRRMAEGLPTNFDWVRERFAMR